MTIAMALIFPLISCHISFTSPALVRLLFLLYLVLSGLPSTIRFAGKVGLQDLDTAHSLVRSETSCTSKIIIYYYASHPILLTEPFTIYSTSLGQVAPPRLLQACVLVQTAFVFPSTSPALRTGFRYVSEVP